VDSEPYDRQELLPSESWPGIPYARRADTGGTRLMARVHLIECPNCGKPLRMLTDKEATRENPRDKRIYQCCGKTWHLMLTRSPGGLDLLALVMKTM
jgi:hypothetical protein